MKLQPSFSPVFPALVTIAEVCLSMPVLNAWPERGCSALKRVKTRLRSRLSVEMLQTLLAKTINCPKVGTPECDSLMNAAVELWENQKKRRKLPRDRATPIPTASNDAANSHTKHFFGNTGPETKKNSHFEGDCTWTARSVGKRMVFNSGFGSKINL